MQRNIQQITQRLVDRLPENEQYYRPDQLRSWGFPSFVVRRITIELEKNLKESMIIPKTDWANTQSEKVRNAWQQFVDAIRAEARLPASYAKTVIETAVADVMEMLVQPRKNIPSIIFEGDEQLSFNQVRERVQTVVVYSHFSELVPRYMHKKDLQKLSKERCAKIISTADEKLTKKYSPLNWAQMLEPLFKMVGGEIDTNLLRLFFEDKKMPRIARKFDLMNDALTRAELIEVLSSPDMLDLDDEDEQSTLLFDNQQTETPANERQQQPDRSSKKQEIEGEKSLSEETEVQEQPPKEDLTETNVSREQDADETTEDDTDQTINNNFVSTEDVEEKENTNENGNSLNAVFREKEEEQEGFSDDEDTNSQPESAEKDQQLKQEADESTEQPSTSTVDKGSGDDGENARNTTVQDAAPSSDETEQQDLEGEKLSGESAEQEETPIWMRYMSDEEIEEYEKKQEREEQSGTDGDEEFIDEPIIDLTNENATDQEIETLLNQLEGDRERFVEEIFRGSDRAFDQAIEDIAAYDNWRDVSKYVKEDVFKRNLVDMYSEAAVDFTDQLQNYFMEKENQS